MKPYFASILFALSMIGLTAHAADDDEIIEFQGDRYVIHVDKMNPDSEMTLLDVLNTCPEFLSINGKKIDQNYKFRADNIGLVVDPQSFLANVKACEIDRIQICSNTSVAKAVNGTKGVIDIYYRKDVKKTHRADLCHGSQFLREGLPHRCRSHDRPRVGRKLVSQHALGCHPERQVHHQSLPEV